MPGDDERWEAVGEAVRARRTALGLTQAGLAEAAEVSEPTVRVLETARRSGYRRGSLRAISRALGWPADGIERIRAGRPPDEDLVAERSAGSLEERLADLEAELARLRAELRARQRT